jgi:type IV secretion system protein VirB10
MSIRLVLISFLTFGLLAAQDPAPAPATPTAAPAEQAVPAAQPPAPAAPRNYTIEPGTKILLSLINSISTHSAAPGDRVYLETSFPVLVGGRIVVPPGSYVTGTITQVKRAGRVKGRAELFVRFDALTLANGTTRDFRGRTASLDGDNKGKLDRDEGKIKGDTDKAGDAMKVATAGSYGAMIGGVANGARGAGIGAGAGAVAGLVGVLATRGPDATLQRGSTMEMLLDRQLTFQEDELLPVGVGSRTSAAAPPPGDASRKRSFPGSARPWP